ncbi:MAG: hypothetical protein PHH30_08950, partial [Bacteroidales bacterium]|nr:hypothetical protein [Bacteroidales bacterium]
MKKNFAITIFITMLSFYTWGQCSNPNAGDDVDVCGCAVSLNVQNATTGSWAAYLEGSPVSVSYWPDNTATSIDVTVADFVEPLLQLDFVWTDDSGPCTDTVVVSFYRKPQPFAGLDDAVCGNNYQLEGSYEITESAGYTPTGVWSVYNHPAGAAANINQMNNDTAQVTVSQVGIWNYVIRENNSLLASCYSTDTVQIEFVEIPVVYAGE